MDNKIFTTDLKEVFVVVMHKVPVRCPFCEKSFIAGAENHRPEQAICPHCSLFVHIRYRSQWQYRSKHDQTWKDCSEEEAATMQHLARFELQQIDL